MAAAKLSRYRQGAVGFVLSRPSGMPATRPWLTVRCSWCDREVYGGCLVCAELVHRLWDVVAKPEFRALRDEAGLHPELIGVLLDWLAEHGIEAEVVP